MPNRNAKRGGKAERRIAEALSTITGLRFTRTPGSGSQHVAAYFADKKVRGDIVCIDDVSFPFLIESKKTKSFVWDLLFTDKPCADFVNFWAKTETDARADDKFPMLVVSRNQGPMVTFTLKSSWEKLGMGVRFEKARMSYKNKQLVITDLALFAAAFNEAKCRNRPNETKD